MFIHLIWFFFLWKNVTQPGIMSCKVSKQMNACCSNSMFTALSDLNLYLIIYKQGQVFKNGKFHM